MTQLSAWILAAMLVAEPKSPHRATFENSAEVMADVATAEPLFAGALGPKRTAAWFVSVMWFESRFDQKAKGDCRKKDTAGKCVAHASYCGMQVGVSNAGYLGIQADELLDNFGTCVRSARKLMKVSIAICRERPEDDWLGHYAAGGEGCRGLKESGNRVRKAKWLFSNVAQPSEPLPLNN